MRGWRAPKRVSIGPTTIDLPEDFSDDHSVLDVEHFVLVQASVVHGVVVAFGQQHQFSILVCLLGHDSVHDRNVLAFELIHNDVAIDDGRVLREEKHVASLHRWLHRA